MSDKSGKRVRGIPVDWDEVKKPRTINLTDTAWILLGEAAKADGVSRSEKLERLIRLNANCF